MEAVSQDNFDEWKHHPVTKRLMKMLNTDRETMKEGLVNNAFDDEQEVKGRCRAIAIILNLEYEDLFEATIKREPNE
jgi:aminoglycoside phosphotransferase